jgi:light-regulated signal transduction histidine kinase (bacteriophytochrome)
VASHDLQEPLRTIGRFTQLVKHRYGKDLPEDANEFMDYAVDGAQRMQGLVDDLLTYSRVGTKSKEFDAVPLDAVADQVLAGLTVAIDDQKATITKDALPVVKGDRAQLAQIYQNLIANAIKFRRPNRRPKVHLGAEKRGGEWVLSVQDNGIGIPKEQFDRIFVIFQRLHARDEYEGTGIGLAVAKKIIERHGGRIWLESDPKRGTTFFFSLPTGAPGMTK